MLLEAIVKSVPSPSIFSPSSPKVRPMLAPMLISPFVPTVIVRSVSSDSIFSCVPNNIPTFAGTTTSAVAVRLMLFPEIVKSVPSPSIFSASSPNVNPMFAGMFISAPAVRLMSPVPFAAKVSPMLVSPPVAVNDGGFPVAAFVTSIWLTADDVVWNISCSFPLASAIKPASANLGAVSVLFVSVNVADA